MNSTWLADSIWGRMLAWLIYDGPAALANHLWQSTLFALMIGMMVLLLRKYSARLRFALWMVASLKFLLPFTALAVLGAQFSRHPEPVAPTAAAPQVLAAAAEFAAPMAPVEDHWQLMRPPRAESKSSTLSYATLYPVLALIWAPLIWALGALLVAGRWLLRWRTLRRTLRDTRAISSLEFPAPVRVTTEALEPGIVGIVKPVLLVPAGMEELLQPEQIRAVLAHELYHLRRRDNLTAALHMLVETLFWFHPLVWWMGRRLIDERERACDEQVVREGHAPQGYAEAILRVCEHYLASRLPCVSGVSGSDLRKRIESIVKSPLIARLNASKKFILATLACIAVATPITAGIIASRAIEGRSHYRNAMNQYWALLQATNEGATLCPGRTTALSSRQAKLAADVAGIDARDGSKALLLAVLANRAADVRRLLAEGAVHDGDGFLLEDSLMHIAAQFGDPTLLQVLLDAGFDVNGMAAPLGGGKDPLIANTPLMIAISRGRKDNAAWLIQHGADASAVNGAGTSALVYAMSLCKDQQLTTQLIEAGAQPNDKARRIATNMKFDLGAAPAPRTATSAPDSGTPYEIAGRQVHDVSAAEASTSVNCPGRSNAVLQAQLPLRATVAKLSAGDGPNVLRYAVMANSEKDVRRLLAAGAAHADGDAGPLPVAAHFADAPVLQALVDAGFSVNQRDFAGGTALLDATIAGRTDNVAWLIQHGADVNAGHGGGHSLLMQALYYCRSQVQINLLLRAGARPDAKLFQGYIDVGLLSAGTVAMLHGSFDPPQGWEAMTPEELGDQAQRGNSPSLYMEARADLDGDGNADSAALFVATDGGSEGLFVKLSSQRPEQWRLVTKVDHHPTSRMLSVGIGVEKEGVHRTACAKGYGKPCKQGEPAEVVLKYPGLAYFSLEGASSLFYWDVTTRALKQAWISD